MHRNVDSQVTLDWVAQGTPDRPKNWGPPLTLAELMALPAAEVGYVLFGPLRNMTRGAAAFREFVQVDFIDPKYDMISSRCVAHDTLFQVLEITKELVRDAKDDIMTYQNHRNAMEGVKASATQAAANIMLLAEAESDPGKKQNKLNMAKNWLDRELLNLRSRDERLERTATAKATTAGVKLMKFLQHLRTHDDFSEGFKVQMELWQELDSTDVLAISIGKSETLGMLAQSSKVDLETFGSQAVFADTQVDEPHTPQSAATKQKDMETAETQHCSPLEVQAPVLVKATEPQQQTLPEVQTPVLVEATETQQQTPPEVQAPVLLKATEPQQQTPPEVQAPVRHC